MENDWQMKTLGDLLKYSKDRIKVENLNNKNYISTENMLPNKGGVINASGIPNCKTVTKYEYGSVLISNIRPYFKKIWYANKEGGASNDVLVLKNIDNQLVESKYMYYCLLDDKFFNYMMSGSKGTKMPRGDKNAILKYEIKIPPLMIQKKVTSILSSLDDKIKLNNEMNKTLEQMAQAIFKSWFVDFEPFKDGEFEESELGMIPKGWKVVKIGDICDVKGGKRLPKGSNLLDCKTDYPYLRVTDVTNGYIDIEQIKYIDYDTRSKISKYIIRYEDVYISIAGTIGVVGTIYKDIDNASLTENMARIIVSNSNVFRNYIRIYLQSREGQNNIKSRTVGSTQPKLPLYAIRAIPIIIPPNKIINDFAKFVNPMIEKIESNLNEISYFKGIRDTLLPKLISGEIKL